MNTKPIFKTNLSIADAPITKKKSVLEKEKRLGIIDKKIYKNRTYILHIDTINAITLLKNIVKEKTNLKLSRSQILDLVLTNAAEKPENIIKIIKR